MFLQSISHNDVVVVVIIIIDGDGGDGGDVSTSFQY